ncbi:MAG TPA: PAS domain-containing protein [Rhizomicrobium sp.]|nr:PAS domain-containing protein [Rhizomicrobium sp.]
MQPDDNLHNGQPGMNDPQAVVENAMREPRQRAASLQPACGAGVLAAILDHLSIPIMLVDAKGAVLYANDTARVCAAAALTRAEHALPVQDHRDIARLRQAIGNACENEGQHAIVTGEAGAEPGVAVIVPLTGERNCALVLMRGKTGIKQLLPNILRELFNLSAAEAEVAVALWRGADINQVARDRGVKRNTLRSQLASIMERTRTHRQAELVALVGRIDAII